MKDAGERAGLGEGDGKGRTAQPLPKLADIGITKTQSSRYQAKARAVRFDVSTNLAVAGAVKM